MKKQKRRRAAEVASSVEGRTQSCNFHFALPVVVALIWAAIAAGFYIESLGKSSAGSEKFFSITKEDGCSDFGRRCLLLLLDFQIAAGVDLERMALPSVYIHGPPIGAFKCCRKSEEEGMLLLDVENPLPLELAGK
ncbi:hypothetical protein ACLOJK_019220 [Asimina triloba]